MSLAYNELKKGMALDIENKPCILLEYSRSKKDRGAPVIKMRYKEIISGKVLTKSFSGYDIKIESAEIERVAATFMYSDHSLRKRLLKPLRTVKPSPLLREWMTHFPQQVIT